MKKSILLTSLVGATLLLVGCGGDKKVEDRVTEIQKNDTNSAAPANNAAAKDAAKAVTASVSPEEGKSIFSTKCSFCHGEKAQGMGIYPKLVGNTKDDVLRKLNGYIDGSYGKAQKGIMIGQAKALSDSQKSAVAEYIATLK